MGETYLDIDARTKGRLGFYKDITDVVDIQVLEWFKKEGDVIGAIEDPDTGNITGEPILHISSAKGKKIIEGIGDEIGARIFKILIPAGEMVTIDIREEPFRPAKLDTADGAGIQESKNETALSSAEISGDPDDEETSNTKEQEHGEKRIRISPLARIAAEEYNISLDDIVSFYVQRGAIEITKEDVKAYHESATMYNRDKREVTELHAAPDVKGRIKALVKEGVLNVRDIVPTGPDAIIRMADVDRALLQTKKEANDTVIPEADDSSMSEQALYAPMIEQPTVRRLTIARSQQRAWNNRYDAGRGINIPMAGGGRDIDVTHLIALREKLKNAFAEEHGMKLRYDHFFLAAVASLLRRKELSILNSCWEWLENKQGRIVRFGHINLAIAIDHPEGLLVPVIRKCEEKSFIAIAKETEEILSQAQNNSIELERMEGRTFTVNNAGALGVEYPRPVVPEGNAAIVAFGRIRKNGMMYVEIVFDHRAFDAGPPERFMTQLKMILEECPEQLLYV